ncbi:MAG: type I glyceraldehyde-3-phosphate dehydrogenase [Candidatus Kerfeldbacteria bacterium RIFCSPLOWO2_01_FULL_48_11]|uniref:Glyceraldehyde-3-phosphate dehydrogenase n=1 Tax=Candidatus Kerfeldbacteria bacterium RIFCSPLOWO2_01_FULL_48_11 TaxID=1798543 RepID=A0A1G2B5G2_9BACT|nr:MAG: Glyceraldehyde-3-phosphate dehydrogenase, type I [Parcubacteria group bacterium GW2011_GWA2_48_9]OGY84411.1 MAG: type I glyceraldehyde-3-phosphate dehydrogenase [Candidatus Kerfeldbacteria bacterium RIFCSPLOWO2_01_FULL_48_11]HCM68093.1 type I glyceraldehyde-3-phosphate dehydrogenase [Candidatus Kerfeldbacteria bacterium]
MKKIRLAINGFGRIGRAAFKIALKKNDLEVVALNDLTDTKTLAHLFKYDSVYGKYDKDVSHSDSEIIVGGTKYPVYAEKDPENLPWKKLQVDVVIESTGHFVKDGKAAAHIRAGAKRVIISAPAKGGNVDTIVLGVNEDKLKGQELISNASCTTNCIAPVVKVLLKEFGIEKVMMTTIHSYTADQNLIDAPHKDLRRARAAAYNIVPTSTGAAIATAETIPELKGLFDGLALRVPTICGSLSDFVFILKKKVTKEEVNTAIKKAAASPAYKGILEATEEPIVSSDIIGNSHSSIVDLSLTNVVDGNMVKVVAWYDNEMGYSHRLVEMVEAVGKGL